MAEEIFVMAYKAVKSPKDTDAITRRAYMQELFYLRYGLFYMQELTTFPPLYFPPFCCSVCIWVPAFCFCSSLKAKQCCHQMIQNPSLQ